MATNKKKNGKDKKLGMRIFVLLIVVVMFLGIIILPLL